VDPALSEGRVLRLTGGRIVVIDDLATIPPG
jgi:hypothetical protein